MMVDGLLGYLINAAWQAPLLAGCTWILTRVSQLAPRGRNCVWLACLALTLVLPMVDLGGAATPKAPAVAADTAPATRVVDLRPSAPTPTFLQRPAPEAIAPPRVALKLDDRLGLALLAVFALALTIGLGRLTVGWLAVRRLVRDAEEATLPPAVTAELAAFAATHRARAPRVRQSAQTFSPVAAGAFRPVILIPVNFAARPEDELRAALLHELAHVIRRDYAVNLLSEIAALPLCWHPALHAIKAEVRRSRELVCDAMASAAMRSETAYARNLLALAKSLEIQAPRGASVAMGLFGKSLLEERLMHLIGPKKSGNAAPKTVELIAGGVIAAGVVGVAALLHVSTALAQPTAPVTAVPAMPAVAAAPAEPAAQAEPAQVADSMVIDDDAVTIMDSKHGRYRHRWTSASGRTYDVRNDDAQEPSAAERARLEQRVDGAMAEAAKAKAMLNSPAFKAQMADAMKAEDVARLAQAEAMKAMNDPKVQAAIARAQQMASSAEVREAQAEAMRVMNDPKIQAELAEARDSQRVALVAQAEAQKVLNDPEIKAEIARARRLESSPEFRKAPARTEGRRRRPARAGTRRAADLKPEAIRDAA